MLCALAIVTASSLTFQVALTRTLAAMLAYHYGFLAISLSLLGIGAAGLYVRPAWFERRTLVGGLAMTVIVLVASALVPAAYGQWSAAQLTPAAADEPAAP